MKSVQPVAFLSLMVCLACGQELASDQTPTSDSSLVAHRGQSKPNEIIDPSGRSVVTRFVPAPGYDRTPAEKHSFAYYLRNLPLKPEDAEVTLYNGLKKSKGRVYDAVVDLEIGNKDLHQCADAVMRLRAEYLWNQKQYGLIHFNFTNGFRVDYSEWMKGKRVVVKGNSTYWSQTGNPSNTYRDFWKYMETIFSYAGTLSLSKELKSVPVDDLQAGDVFIQGGSPGHAVIVVDVAISPKTNKKIFLLAQSYMPAQETQILKNPNDETISPWYAADFGELLYTPEWTFNSSDLKRFTD